MSTRLVVLFAVSFVLSTSLDEVTTLALTTRGYIELNPHTDFSSMEALLIPDVIAFVVGCVSTYAGARMNRDQIEHLARTSGTFGDFSRRFLRGTMLPSAMLILIPIIFAIERIEPVVSNSMLLTLGWGVTDKAIDLITGITGIWDPYHAYGLFLFFISFALIRPVTYVIYRICRRSVA